MNNGTASTRQMLELAAVVTRNLPSDISPAHAQYLIENGEKVATLLRQSFLRDDKSTYPWVLNAVTGLLVDYNLPLTDAIMAGRYDWVSPDITAEHFPTLGTGQAQLDVELIHFGDYMSNNDVLAELDTHGLRPVELLELLALGATYPDLQRRYPIVALGSVWQGQYPSLHMVVDMRDVRLWNTKDRWSSSFRFAAVSIGK